MSRRAKSKIYQFFRDFVSFNIVLMFVIVSNKCGTGLYPSVCVGSCLVRSVSWCVYSKYYPRFKSGAL